MRILRILVVIVALSGCAIGMTRQQLKKTLGLMKNSCMSKTGATEDKVNKIDQGVFLEEKSVMCYVACIYKSINVTPCRSSAGNEFGVDEILQARKVELAIMLNSYNVEYIKTLNDVKNNKLDGDLISKQIDMLYPQDMKESVKKGVAQCMPVQNKYNDMCEGIFYSTKCLYESDPKNFIFA